MAMTGCQRLMATLRGEPVDRPAVNFYEIGGLPIQPNDPCEFNIYQNPSWKPLLDLAENHTDIIRMRSPVRSRPQDPEMNLNNAAAEHIAVREYFDGGSRFVHTALKVAGRTMTSLTRRDRDIDTIWNVEHLLKNTEDIEAYLQLPDDFFLETINIDYLLEEENQVGDKGIVMVDTEDPLCAAAALLSMADFTIIALTEQTLFHRLIEKHVRHIYARTQKVAKEFPGRLWRIYGPEYAVEPYLPPQLFREYVVRYVTPMIEMIHQFGGFARIHAHGNIGAVLPDIVKMGADAIDPIEPPPQGNVDLAAVRREYGKDMVLFGNIEISDLENMESASFEKLVRQTLHDGTLGTGRGFVLMPSSSPYGLKITDQTLANYTLMVELVNRFG